MRTWPPPPRRTGAAAVDGLDWGWACATPAPLSSVRAIGAVSPTPTIVRMKRRRESRPALTSATSPRITCSSIAILLRAIGQSAGSGRVSHRRRVIARIVPTIAAVTATMAHTDPFGKRHISPSATAKPARTITAPDATRPACERRDDDRRRGGNALGSAKEASDPLHHHANIRVGSFAWCNDRRLDARSPRLPPELRGRREQHDGPGADRSRQMADTGIVAEKQIHVSERAG